VKRFRRGRIEPGASGPVHGEVHDPFVEAEGFRVEQIRSGRVPTPVEFIQAHDEWVMLIEGSALMEVAERRVELAPGDWVLLPSNLPHRLLRVEPGTSWIAVHGLTPGLDPDEPFER
jgi:cupin 2 domain-containing protein